MFEPQGVSNLEGLLRPDTYKISESEDEIGILQTMVTAFDSHAAKLGLTNASVHGLTPYQIIIVASMVEAEAKVPQDRPLIASVIYNRLAQHMKLQIDSTVIYALGQPRRPAPLARGSAEEVRRTTRTTPTVCRPHPSER